MPDLSALFRFRTLESKCRWLFAVAIMVIMASALCWPWIRMESLVDEQNLRVAREAARLELIRFHKEYEKPRDEKSGDLEPRPLAPLPADPSAPSDARDRSAPGPEALRVEALGDGTRPPRWILGNALTDPSAGKLEPFEIGSLEHLRHRPGESEANEVEAAELGRVYRYVVLFKNTGRCVSCHTPTAAAASAKPFAAGENMGAISITLPLPADDWSMVANRAVIVLAGVLGVAFAMMVFYWIAHRLILEPVHELKSVAERVSHGDLSARSSVATGDEFQHLAETFNGMVENLVSDRRRLENANVGLDIKLGELAQVNVGLYEANKLKTEFLANVTHELRTPLNSIIGFADLLKDTADDDRGRRWVGNILIAARNLLELIDDLLDLAKIEAGRMDVHLSKLSISDLVETLQNLMKPLADQKELRLETEIDPRLPLIRTDPAKVRQIVYNFLSNAVKFTPRGGRITLSAKLVDDRFAAISVADTGPGIAREHQQVIFEKFRQLDGSVTREHQGTGLGLAISKELAALLGGGLRLDSEPGKGATFTVNLPLNAEGVSESVRLSASLVSA